MNNNNYETMKKTASFHDKYKSRIATRTMSEYFVKNEKNDLKIFLENTDVILISEKNVDLNDNELNEFLCSYKKVIDDKKINIILCENTKSYEY